VIPHRENFTHTGHFVAGPSLFRLRDGSGTKKNIPYPVSDDPAEKNSPFFQSFFISIHCNIARNPLL
jgi:hypothetical protein